MAEEWFIYYQLPFVFDMTPEIKQMTFSLQKTETMTSHCYVYEDVILYQNLPQQQWHRAEYYTCPVHSYKAPELLLLRARMLGWNIDFHNLYFCISPLASLNLLPALFLCVNRLADCLVDFMGKSIPYTHRHDHTPSSVTSERKVFSLVYKGATFFFLWHERRYNIDRL